MSTQTQAPPATGAANSVRQRRVDRSDRRVMGMAHLVLALWAVIVILPMLWTLMSSFKTSSEIFGSAFELPASLNMDNYVTAWVDHGIGGYFLNTVIVVGVALVLVMLLGAMCSYVLARYEFPGRMGIYYLMLAGLTFPIFLAIVPLFFVLQNFGLLNALPGLIITYVAFALPFTLFRSEEHTSELQSRGHL